MKRTLAKRAISRRQACGLLGCAIVALLLEGGCNSTSTYVSPYDWNALRFEGEHLVYDEGGTVRSKWGIDVSEHQHEIDWPKVGAAGIEFAFVRIGNRGATAGALDTDEHFLPNALGAAQAGIALAGYFFSQAITEEEAREEALYTLQQLRTAELQGASFEAIAYDHESVDIEGARANDLTTEELSRNTAVFCDTIQRAGYAPLVYGNQRDLLRLSEAVRSAYPLWLAEYDVAQPTAPFDFSLWQYTNEGIIDGISTAVDLNIWLPPLP